MVVSFLPSLDTADYTAKFVRLSTGMRVFFTAVGQGNIVRPIDITAQKEYDYIYDEGKITSASAYDVTINEQENVASEQTYQYMYPEKGRQLKSLDGITYTYNANGIRTSKTVNGVCHEYLLDGTKILRETWKTNGIVHTLIPLYDNEDSVCGIVYNNTPYYFLKNQQGDIISITDSAGKVVANYTYDAWGKLTNITGTALSVASINPFRYRGYYYDSEISMYYLQSRYYDPETGRFVNADAPQMCLALTNMVGTDLFTYGMNSVVNMVDMYGLVAVSSTNNYYTISFNNWETTMIIGAVTLGFEAVGAVLAIVAAIPTLGISTAVGVAVCTVGLFVFSILSFMNLAGNNKGLSINISRRWYLGHYIGINKKEPKGFNDIWELFNAIKAGVKTIVKKITVAVVASIANMYSKARKAIHRLIVLVKMIYDYYCGRKVSRNNYKKL